MNLAPGWFGKGPYKGAVRDGNRLLWKCPHQHKTREQDGISDISARTCGALVYLALTDSGDVSSRIERLRRWMRSGKRRGPWDDAGGDLYVWAESAADELRSTLEAHERTES